MKQKNHEELFKPERMIYNKPIVGFAMNNRNI